VKSVCSANSRHRCLLIFIAVGAGYQIPNERKSALRLNLCYLLRLRYRNNLTTLIHTTCSTNVMCQLCCTTAITNHKVRAALKLVALARNEGCKTAVSAGFRGFLLRYCHREN